MPRLPAPTLLICVAAGVVALALAGRAATGGRAGAGGQPALSATETSVQAGGATAVPAGGFQRTTTDPTVHVAGAVRRPGVYRLAAGSRVRDAVRRAGGASRRGDANAINLAAKVADGQQILVPLRASDGSPGVGASGSGGAVAGGPVSLGSATAEQLDTLDGVGPATAAKIIQWRTDHGGFSSVDDLGEIPGIGPKKLEALRPQVTP